LQLYFPQSSVATQGEVGERIIEDEDHAPSLRDAGVIVAYSSAAPHNGQAKDDGGVP